MGDRDEPLLGQFSQRAHVRPHVQLAAHQHHFGVGAELLRLALPLHKEGGNDTVSPKKGALAFMPLLLKVLNTVKHNATALVDENSCRCGAQTKVQARFKTEDCGAN